MYTEGHGGDCCGISHVVDFYKFTEHDESNFNAHMDECEENGTMCEVVLIDQELGFNEERASFEHDAEEQKESKQRLINALARWGFFLVTRFINGNSSNYCNVFHYHPNRELRKGIPNLVLSKDGKVLGTTKEFK